MITHVIKQVYCQYRGDSKAPSYTFKLCCCCFLQCHSWVFGDNGYKEFKFKPPYDPALRCPYSPNQVKLSNNVTYVYSQPGNIHFFAREMKAIIKYLIELWKCLMFYFGWYHMYDDSHHPVDGHG